MKIKWKYKLHSGALQFTVFIAVLVALLLAAVVLLAYTHRFYMEQSKAIVDNIQLADSGISYLKGQEVVITDTLLLDVPDSRQGQEIKVNLSSWGIFEKAYVRSTHRKKQFIKTAFLGTYFTKADRFAIYLEENFIPLAVVGNTRINGNALLPQQGIRTGNISGNSYYGLELIYGQTAKSDTLLPKLKYDYKKLLKYYLYEYQPQSNTDFVPLDQEKNIINSFHQLSKGYYTNSPLVLENLSITGNIIIKSLVKITVKPSAILTDIILVAPEIIIEDGVKGTFQTIADTSIRIGSDCVLNYPSALVLLEKEDKPINMDDPFFNTISIGERTKIRGSLCYFGTHHMTSGYKTNILINNGNIKGEIYCEGNLELKNSKITGAAYTKYFVTNEGGTTFVNHIYNSIINSEDLPENFGGILFDKSLKSVMKWTY